MNSYDSIVNNIIGLNPTGIIQFNESYTFNGNNNIMKNSKSAAKENLIKSQNNKIICNHIENFENFKNSNFENVENYLIFFFIIILIILVLK
jgi:hypothetical protein